MACALRRYGVTDSGITFIGSEMKLLSFITILIWLPGYFLICEKNDTELYSLYSLLSWQGLPYYILPPVLIFFIQIFRFRKTALALSALILTGTTVLWVLLITYDEKSGEYFYLGYLNEIPEQPAWFFILISSVLMIINAWYLQPKQAKNL